MYYSRDMNEVRGGLREEWSMTKGQLDIMSRKYPVCLSNKRAWLFIDKEFKTVVRRHVKEGLAERVQSLDFTPSRIRSH